MRYLGLALFAEGPTDYRFLPPLLRRITEDICRTTNRDAIEVGDILPLRPPKQFLDADNTTRILEAAKIAADAFNILFIHTDGGGNPDAAHQERVDPAAERIVRELNGVSRTVVAVVPVRKTEAWALVDGDALRGAFGTNLADQELGIPSHLRDVEKISDPKQALEHAYRRVLGVRRQGKRKAANFLDTLGERIRLDRLRQVPAFECFERDLGAALRSLEYLA